MECWSDGFPDPYSSTPTLHQPRLGGRMMANLKRIIQTVLFSLGLLAASPSRGEEVFIGNPGKSLNFFHFDLAIERGIFRELGLDVKLLNTKCDVAVTALLTGDLQATGCVGTASRAIASQNVPVRTVVWLFKKPTFYVVARPRDQVGGGPARQNYRDQFLR